MALPVFSAAQGFASGFGEKRASPCQAFLLWSTGSRVLGFSSVSSQAVVAPWHVGSSWSRDHVRVSYIGR